MAAADIVAVGEILVEVMTDRVNQTFLQPGPLTGPYPSGAPAIFADSCAKTGGHVYLVSCVGQDDFGTMCLNRLGADGVDVSHVQVRGDYTTGVAFVTYFDSGERRFIYHFAQAAAGQIALSARDEARIAQAGYLHIMGCSIVASPRNLAAVSRAVDIALQHGVTISFDPNVRPELLQSSAQMDACRKIIRSAGIVLTGSGELEWMTGQAGLADGAQYLLGQNARIVVVKSGAGPVRLFTAQGEERTCQGGSYGPFVDATGAGDCFDGAFIACLSQGLSPEKALQLATVAGAVSVTRRGPMEGTSSLQQLCRLAGDGGRPA